jgi:hypothetical protein
MPLCNPRPSGPEGCRGRANHLINLRDDLYPLSGDIGGEYGEYKR